MSYATKIAGVAQGELERFRGVTESQEPLKSRIRQYWSAIEPLAPVTYPWGGVFTSFCVKSAGVDASEFAFSPNHSVFAHFAIRNAIAGTGVFRGRDAAVHAPNAGDILVLNRVGGGIDYQQAADGDHFYMAHSAIVVERGNDEGGAYLRAVRGNLDDAIGVMVVRVDAGGIIQPTGGHRYITVIEAVA